MTWIRHAGTGLCVLGALLSVLTGSAAVQLDSDGDSLILENDGVRLDLNASTLTLKQLCDRTLHRDYIAMPGSELFYLSGLIEGEAPPVWYAMPVGIPVRQRDFLERKAEKFEQDGRKGWKLQFSGNPKVDMVVTVTVTLAPDSPLFEWRIAVENHSEIPLQAVSFPLIGGIGSSASGSEKTDYLALPVLSGRRCPAPRKKSIAGSGMCDYPGGGMTLQCMTYCDGAGGSLYYATHDGAAYRKTFETVAAEDGRSFGMRVIHYPEIPAAQGQWELPYPVLCGPIAGDWYDAAKIYRHWAITQPRWTRSLAERTDIPEWFRNLPVWFQGNEWSASPEALAKFADRVVALRKALGYDCGFHWYLWQKYLKHDYAYPDYLPARPGFADAAAKVQAAGVRVMPYLNIHLCETALPVWASVKAAAKINSQGQLYRSYGVGGSVPKALDTSGPVDVFRGDETVGRDMVPMCTGELVWQNLMVGIAKQVVDDYHVDGIYYDETYVFPGLCYAKNHRHPWIGGTYHTDGIDEIHKRTAALRPGQLLTSGENLGEAYIDQCMALFNGHSDIRADSLPIFQTVFSDRTTEIGVFTSAEELSDPERFVAKLSFGLLRGRQLGWLYSDQNALALSTPEYAVQLDLLRHYCDVRLAGLPWLYEGEMLRAPDLSALPVVTRRWLVWPAEKTEFTFPVVNAAVYRAPDGSLGIILANLTDETQSVEFPWNFKDWGIQPGRSLIRSEYRHSQWSGPGQETPTDVFSARLAPFEAVIVCLKNKS